MKSPKLVKYAQDNCDLRKGMRGCLMTSNGSFQISRASWGQGVSMLVRKEQGRVTPYDHRLV